MVENIPRLKALRVLAEVNAGKLQLTAEGLHDVVLQATGSKERAEKAAYDQILEQLRAGQTPQ